jgi:hypothetical protein
MSQLRIQTPAVKFPATTPVAHRRARRIARIIALAVVIAIGINHVWWALADWHLRDMNAYWDAAMRLRTGRELYAPMGIEASEVYRYSPWFAWVWVPVTMLPRVVANIGWSAVLLGASAVAVWPLVRRRSVFGVAFFLPMLIGISAVGNVHPLLIATLVLGIQRRTGPLWIAVAASLKVIPILLVVTYLGRREWKRSALAIATTVALTAPVVLYDLSNYVTDAGAAALLWRYPVIYVAAVAVALAAAFRLASTRFGWLTSSIAVTLALPRFFVYDVLYLLVGTAGAEAVPSRAGASTGADTRVEAASLQPAMTAGAAKAR